MRQLSVFVLLMIILLAQQTTVQAQPQAHSIDSLKIVLQQSRPDTGRANLLLELARSYVMKPGEKAADLDTALVLVRQGYAISRYFHFIKGEGNAYLVGAQAYREKGDFPQAQRFGQTAINRFSKNGNKAELAAAYMELGNAYGNEGEGLKQKIVQYERALPLFREVRQKEREATTLYKLTEFYYLRQNYTKADELARQSLAIYQSINYPDMQGIYDLLGSLSSINGDFKMALEYGLLALKTAELRKDTTTQLCTIYNRVGVTYYNLLDYPSALQYFNQALDVAKKHKDFTLIGASARNVANAHTRLRQYKQAITLLVTTLNTYPEIDLAYKALMNGSIIGSYQSMGQYAKSKPYSDRMLGQLAQLRKINREYEVVALAFPPLIHYFISTRQLGLAKSFLTRLEEQTNQSGTKRQKADKQRLVFRLDSAQGNYLPAIKSFMTYKALYDSLNIESKNKEIARLSVEFETEKKEQELKLNKANILLLKNQNQVQQNTQKFMILGACMLVLLLGVTYNRYRLKQRSNQQLEAKQRLIDQKNQSLQQVLGEKEQLLEEREWMLKEIHHRVKNNLQVISSMLNSQFDFLNDPTALSAIRESQNRVQVMALIHQKLYQSDNLGQIGMQQYIHEIVEYLLESFDRESTVTARCELADVHLDVALATPLGLIINEAVTNSLKYAFPQNRPGQVAIELVALDDQVFRLTMSDDGVGLPADLDIVRSQSLGLTMIRGLSKQIKAQLDIASQHGVVISLQFSGVKKPVKTAPQIA